jgi:hypothetical protein
VSLLRQRLETTQLSALMTALLNSLLAALKGLPEEAVCWMESADTTREPEILIYFARHYAFLDMPAQAVTALQRARKAGFLCAPDTLQSDPWFSSLRQFRGFDSLLNEAEAQVAAAHSKYAQAPWSIIKMRAGCITSNADVKKSDRRAGSLSGFMRAKSRSAARRP